MSHVSSSVSPLLSPLLCTPDKSSTLYKRDRLKGLRWLLQVGFKLDLHLLTNQEMSPRDTPVVRTSIRRTIIHQAFILKLVHL